MLIPLTPNDIPWIVAHMHAHYPPAYAYLWEDDGDWYIDTMYSPEKLAEEFSDPGARFFRVADEKEVYGYCKVIHGKAPKQGGKFSDYFYLQRLYLATSAQGRGIGGRVVDQLFDMARTAGHEATWLETMEIGRARSFYERRGFYWIDRIRLNFPGMVDAYRGLDVMEKPLT